MEIDLELYRREIRLPTSPYSVYITQDLPDITPHLGHIETPTLVVWGQKDLTLRPESFPPLVDALPNARSFAIPGCGHQPHIGKPETIANLTLRFFQSLNQIDGQVALR